MAATGITQAIQRLQREQQMIAKTPVPGVRFEPGSDETPLIWTMFVESPEEYVVGTETRKCPFAGRVFPIRVVFPDNYPFKAPDLEFAPGMMYHPQVSKDGKLCAEDITKSFGPTKNVTHLAQMVRNLMAQPNMDTAPEAEIMAEMREKLATYEEKARKAAEKAPRK